MRYYMVAVQIPLLTILLLAAGILMGLLTILLLSVGIIRFEMSCFMFERFRIRLAVTGITVRKGQAINDEPSCLKGVDCW
jgi:hypothetical protein